VGLWTLETTDPQAGGSVALVPASAEAVASRLEEMLGESDDETS
jgi:hypothetical protein